VNAGGYNSYYVYDRLRPDGIAYYRLQLTDATIVNATLQRRASSVEADAWNLRLYSLQGQLLARKQFAVSPGMNQLSAALPPTPDAIYVVTVTDRQGKTIYSNKIRRQH
jgi:hypothetical protein